MENIEKNTAVQPEAKAEVPKAPDAVAPKVVKPAVAKPVPAAPTTPAENALDLVELTQDNFRQTIEADYQAGFTFLECLTGMDWGEEGLGVIYNLENPETGARKCYKIKTADRVNPVLPSVCTWYDIANIYEREAYDFYGIKFVGNPDMRRIYLREDWVGYPMRKDDEPEKFNPTRMTNEPLADETSGLMYDEDGVNYHTERSKIFEADDYVVNIGPQHPSTHGVLHFRVKLEGETIRKIDPVLGYIHRGVEKLNEQMTYPQTLALTDRLDYLGAMQNRHALCMCIEKAMGVEVSDRVQVIRTIMDELQRIDSHILFFSCLAQDLGATTAFLYGFRDREKILDIFEETCGGRLILNYNTIGGVMADIHPNFQKRVKEFIPYMRKAIREYYDVFINNVIFRNRAIGVGILSKEDCISYGCTGGTGRASGWHNDVRKRMPYAAYDKVQFNEVVRTEGDSYARTLVRMDEILESLSIIEQLIDNIPEGNYQEKMKPIIKVPAGTYYSAVEGSRGEFGVLLESRGDKSPYRLHYRSTGLPLVAVMDHVCQGHMLADLITIGGTLDYVVPDIDR
jgi:NADH-quinone oxidoreductase subunit C/D